MAGIAGQLPQAEALLKLFDTSMTLSPRLGSVKFYTTSLPPLFFLRLLAAIEASMEDGVIMEVSHAFNVSVWSRFAPVYALESSKPHKLLTIAREHGLAPLTALQRAERLRTDCISNLAMYLDPAVTSAQLIDVGFNRASAIATGLGFLLSQLNAPEKADTGVQDLTAADDDDEEAAAGTSDEEDGGEGSGARPAGAGAGAGAGSSAGAGSGAGAPAQGGKRQRQPKQPDAAPRGSNFESPAVVAAKAAEEARVAAARVEVKRLKDACAAEVASTKAALKQGQFETDEGYQGRVNTAVAAVKLRWKQPDSSEPGASAAGPTLAMVLQSALKQEMEELDKQRELPDFVFGDAFAPCSGHPEVTARYAFWPSRKQKSPLLYVLASTVLAGGCGGATAISNESLHAIAKFVTCMQRSSAGIEYLSDAALCRATLPQLIAQREDFQKILQRGDANGGDIDYHALEIAMGSKRPDDEEFEFDV